MQWENDVYRLVSNGSTSVGISSGQSKVEWFRPQFTVWFRQSDPKMSYKRAPNLQYNVPTWQVSELLTATDSGFLPHEFEAGTLSHKGQTQDYFHAGLCTTVTANKIRQQNAGIKWEFPTHDLFYLQAEVTLLPGNGEPKLSFSFTPKQDGWFSVGYTGAPESAPDKTDAIWQPLVWQEQAFPPEAYLTPEFNCPIPTCLLTQNDVTVGVVADPTEMPFRLPTAVNSRFGVMVRNQSGNAQPLLVAPVLGGTESHMQAGTTYSFCCRLLVWPGDWLQSFEHLARGLYQFSDYRQNGLCTLNETLENMITYALDDYYSAWQADLRGCSYQTDVPGAVKIVSAAHPLGVALVTDREEIFQRRAIPMVEFLLSREKFIFATRKEVVGQGASHALKGPCAPISEVVALSNMAQSRTTVFGHTAHRMWNKPEAHASSHAQITTSWQDALAMYRLTGQTTYLKQAQDGADAYITHHLSGSRTAIDAEAFFWTAHAPKWADLCELYEETKVQRYLDAAVRAAKQFCAYIWLAPVVPNGDILMNSGGKATKYWYARGPLPMDAPEESVPAWRVSEIGLTSESSGTCHGHRAIFPASHAPYFLRLAHYSGDAFLRAVGRSAIVGRYANFPGYHMNTARSTVYEKPNYPYHEFAELTYNTFHFNHIWPHIALLIDYLVADVFDRSQGQISFPAEFTEGYAYFYSRVYGHKPGTFYNQKDTWLWMPSGLVQTSNLQLNYIAARGEYCLYLAFTNQSTQLVEARITLAQEHLQLDHNRTYNVQIWHDNVPSQSTVMEDGEIHITVTAKGITALTVEGLAIQPQFQPKVVDATTSVLPSESYHTIVAPFGKIVGSLLSFGTDLTSAYIYLEATEDVLIEARLCYKTLVAATVDESEPAAVFSIVDREYPYEFSIPITRDVAQFVCWVEGITPNGDRIQSETMILRLK